MALRQHEECPVIRNLKMNRALKLKIIVGLVVVVGGPLALYLYAGARYTFLCGFSRASCLEHLTAGCTMDGVYEVKAGSRTVDATCDMKSDGGGWMLAANYLHQGKKGATTPIVSMNDKLPLLGSTELGKDEAGTAHWGHAGTGLLSTLSYKEVRYKCKTSAHPRTLDFAISSPQCLEYFKTGKGTCVSSVEDRDELLKRTRFLEGHNAQLPARAEKGWKDQGDNASVSYPFFLDWKAHWSPGVADNRWECDDYEPGGKTNTLHQVWLR